MSMLCQTMTNYQLPVTSDKLVHEQPVFVPFVTLCKKKLDGVQLRPQPPGPIGRDPVHPRVNELLGPAGRVHGPDVEFQPGVMGFAGECGVDGTCAAEVESVQTGFLGLLDQFFGSG